MLISTRVGWKSAAFPDALVKFVKTVESVETDETDEAVETEETEDLKHPKNCETALFYV